MVVRINRDLIKYADFDPTKESHPRSIRDLCNDIEKENILLPSFQTYIRWQIEKSIDLLNFQFRGKAAVSPISINKINQIGGEVGTQITFIYRKPIPQNELFNKQSVVDGQQRLTCNYKAYSNHPDFKNIVFDITSGRFLLNYESLKDSQIPVGILYNKNSDVLSKYIDKRPELKSFKISDLLGKVRNKFMGYYYTVNIANDLTEEEQLEWFEVLNLAGTRVTGVQVQLTEMLVKGVDYYTEYAAKFIDHLDGANLADLLVQKSTELSIPLAVLNPALEVLQNRPHKTNFCPIPSDVKASMISKLEIEDLRTLFLIALTGLRKSIDFIKDNNLPKPSRIDYVTYLAGVFMYIDGNEYDKNYLINWYNTVDFQDKGNGDRREIFEKLIKPHMNE